MERNVSLEEISDGKLYELNDMVKADCNGCDGCSACCRGMGESVVLDPLDIWRLTVNLSCTFQDLLMGQLELNVVDGIILPNLNMAKGACAFLNQSGRCTIHAFRPGICRLFPLGRFYENRSFRYFLQVHECRKPGRTKVKVRKWIDVPDAKQYEQFIIDWHYFLKDLQIALKDKKEEQIKAINMEVLKTFYLAPYEAENFYTQFYQRLENSALKSL